MPAHVLKAFRNPRATAHTVIVWHLGGSVARRRQSRHSWVLSPAHSCRMTGFNASSRKARTQGADSPSAARWMVKLFHFLALMMVEMYMQWWSHSFPRTSASIRTMNRWKMGLYIRSEKRRAMRREVGCLELASYGLALRFATLIGEAERWSCCRVRDHNNRFVRGVNDCDVIILD